jgi:hypothetical protein
VIEQLAVIDNRDDRTEIVRLLNALSPAARVEFLHWCVRQVPPGKLPPPAPYGYATILKAAWGCDRAGARLTRMVFLDVCSLLNSWNLDARAVLAELERRGRRSP